MMAKLHVARAHGVIHVKLRQPNAIAVARLKRIAERFAFVVAFVNLRCVAGDALRVVGLLTATFGTDRFGFSILASAAAAAAAVISDSLGCFTAAAATAASPAAAAT